MKNKKKIYFFVLLIIVIFIDSKTERFLNTYYKNVRGKIIVFLSEKYYPYFSSLEKTEHLDILDLAQLENGKKVMQQHKIVFCGISRDNAPEFFKMKRHLESMGEHFKDYRVIVFENDSKDGTKNLLEKWQNENNKIKIINHDFNNVKRPNIKFLADARNFYMHQVNKPEYDDFDIIAVVDMDMAYGFDVRGIYHTFSLFDQWDAVCSNGISNRKGEMYDAFAFRNEQFPWTPSDTFDYWSSKVKLIQKVYPVGSDLVPVKSCFGGLAFYKKEKLKGCFYDSVNDDCEHILFHKCLCNNDGKMYMNPSQIVRYSHYKNFFYRNK